jgi:hypothetical protein
MHHEPFGEPFPNYVAVASLKKIFRLIALGKMRFFTIITRPWF